MYYVYFIKNKREEKTYIGYTDNLERRLKEHKEKVFITKLAADLAKFCQAFNPRPIVYRATDFKTNEYRNLIGGKEFEPEESNPMLGVRGAYRYISDPRVFELEL